MHVRILSGSVVPEGSGGWRAGPSPSRGARARRVEITEDRHTPLEAASGHPLQPVPGMALKGRTGGVLIGSPLAAVSGTFKLGDAIRQDRAT